MSDTKRSATIVTTESGRQYHIACKKGDLSNYIMLVGDPERARWATQYLDAVRFEAQHREFQVYTGTYKGVDLTLFATGISQANIEISIIEICQVTDNPTFIRAGTCGAIQEHIDPGDMVISTGAVRMEDTSTYFAPLSYPALAHMDVVSALTQVCHKNGQRFHLGLTASTSGFYGAQGRNLEGFPLWETGLPEKLAKLNVLNFEMETATLFVLSQIRKIRAGAICAALANRPKDTFCSESEQREAERKCVELTLETFYHLSLMDKEMRHMNTPVWIPKFG